jgi:hypothetical protein
MSISLTLTTCSGTTQVERNGPVVLVVVRTGRTSLASGGEVLRPSGARARFAWFPETRSSGAAPGSVGTFPDGRVEEHRMPRWAPAAERRPRSPNSTSMRLGHWTRRKASRRSSAVSKGRACVQPAGGRCRVKEHPHTAPRAWSSAVVVPNIAPPHRDVPGLRLRCEIRPGEGQGPTELIPRDPRTPSRDPDPARRSSPDRFAEPSAPNGPFLIDVRSTDSRSRPMVVAIRAVRD